MNKIKPLFIWAGGKNKMLKHYIPLLSPPMFSSIETYSEPFFGGGAMFLYVMEHYKPKRVYINDINEGIISIYKNIKTDLNAFCNVMDKYSAEFLPLSKPDRKEYFYKLRGENAWDYQKWSPLEQSAVLYFLMKTGFNGIWQINKNTNNRYGTPSGLLNQTDKVYDKENLVLWNRVLNSTDSVITSTDWKDVPMGDFTFYDPPYRDSFANYNTSFPDTETKELILRVENGKNVWLCNRDSNDGFFDNHNADIHRFNITYTAGRRKKTTDGFEAKKAVEILLTSRRNINH
mgnify:FL=1